MWDKRVWAGNVDMKLKMIRRTIERDDRRGRDNYQSFGSGRI